MQETQVWSPGQEDPQKEEVHPLQYSCLVCPMDRGAWWAIAHGVAKSWTWLSNWEQVNKLEYLMSLQKDTNNSFLKSPQ